MLGYALAALTALSFAANGVVAGRFTNKVDAILAGFVAHLTGSVAILLIAAMSGQLDLTVSLRPEHLLYLALAGITQYALGRAFFFISLRKVGLGPSQIIVQSSPIISVFGAVVLFHEPITARTLLGLACVIGGVLLVMER